MENIQISKTNNEQVIVYDGDVWEFIEYENGFGVPYEQKDYIVKASHNIIDLIEIGDYVNGNKILFKVHSNIKRYKRINGA